MLASSKGLALASECVLLASLLTACSGQGGTSSTPPVSTSQSTALLGHTVDADNDSGGGSVLRQLNTITTIGSTVDPSNGDVVKQVAAQAGLALGVTMPAGEHLGRDINVPAEFVGGVAAEE